MRYLNTHREKLYLYGATTTLLISTLLWSILGAQVQRGNSDQLVNGYLFQSRHTFSQALFPASHTLILKWPLFLLLSLVHNSNTADSVLTVLIALLSVGCLAYLISRIEKRPIVLGSIFIALACVLTLIPAQVLGGVTAPLNMAMLTGRNVEYVLFIGILILYARANKIKSWTWLAATLLISLLIVSDNLFLPLAVGGALILLSVAYTLRQKHIVTLASQWLLGSICGWLLASIILRVVGHFTVIVGSNTSIYGPINSWSNFLQASRYSIKAILQNFGVTAVAGRITIIPALLNLVVLSVVLITSYALVKDYLHNKRNTVTDTPSILSVMLLTTTIAALLTYVFTNHSYAADARYLTISLFTGFVVLASYIRTVQFAANKVVFISGVTLAAITLGLVGVYNYTNQVTNSSLQQSNKRIVLALAQHHVDVLVGDYWRVFPIKAMTYKASQNVIPLGGCLEPVPTLRSQAWQVDLRDYSFAYILSAVSSGTPFPRCNLHMIELAYGPPSSTKVVTGSKQSPNETLLFYDKGAAYRDRL